MPARLLSARWVNNPGARAGVGVHSEGRLCVQHRAVGMLEISLEMLSSRARLHQEHSMWPQGLFSCTTQGLLLSRKEMKPPQPYTTGSQKTLQVFPLGKTHTHEAFTAWSNKIILVGSPLQQDIHNRPLWRQPEKRCWTPSCWEEGRACTFWGCKLLSLTPSANFLLLVDTFPCILSAVRGLLVLQHFCKLWNNNQPRVEQACYFIYFPKEQIHKVAGNIIPDCSYMPYALQLILSTPTPTFPIYGLRLLFFSPSPSLQKLHPSKQLSQLNRPWNSPSLLSIQMGTAHCLKPYSSSELTNIWKR